MIKLFASDVDGTLTDSTVYYSAKGEELKQFSHRDGRGFHLLKEKTKVLTMLITSENGGINWARAYKLIKLGTLNYFSDGCENINKLEKIKDTCQTLGIKMEEVAYIGDDTNDLEILKAVGLKACPADAHDDIMCIDDIIVTESKGGKGAVREFIDMILEQNLCELK